MKCKKCGAEIPQGYLYCSVCGAEVQLVPDYNLLDEDLLGGIVQKEARAGKNLSDGSLTKKKKWNLVIWGSICLVLLIAVLTLFFVFHEIQKKHENTYDYQYQKAEAYWAEEDFTNAVLCFKKALELKPGDKNARERLLELYLKMKNEKEAVSLLEEFVEEDVTDQESIQKLIAIYDQKEEYDKILALSKKVKNRDILKLFSEYIVEKPKFSHISGVYPEAITVAISSAKQYDVYYTMDRKDPVAYGRLYQDEIVLKEEGVTVIKAVARNEKGIYSEPVEVDYTIQYEPPDMPAVSPAGGTYDEPQKITVVVPQNCTAYYTWDGSDPTEGSFRYTSPLDMPQGNQVLSVMLINSAGLKSSIYRVNYIYMP